MQLNNTEWLLVGAGGDASLVMQNVGDVRIAFVIATSLPAPTDITLEGDGHGVLGTGTEPMTITDLDTYSKNMYARALGPRNAQLYVEAN